MTDATLATPAVAASDTIRTIGILHFTIGVRDHIAAAKFAVMPISTTPMATASRSSISARNRSLPSDAPPPGGIGAYTIRAASSWVGRRPFGVS